MFKIFDEDGNGVLSLNELKKAINFCKECKGRPSFKDEALVILLILANMVETGRTVDFQQFLEINMRLIDLENGSVEDQEVMVSELFKIYDINGDGKITASEIIRIHDFLGISPDLDITAELSFEEFRNYVKQNI